jgi:hypothetical protein
MQRLSLSLAPGGQRLASAFSGIGNRLSHWVRPAHYDLNALQAWTHAAGTERRLEAAARIRTSLDTGLLDVTNLHLSELPPLPADLIGLCCSGNPLQRLPVLPSSLRELRISDCPIGALPTLPRELRLLQAARCGLTSLPTRWPDALATLDLRQNQITLAEVLPTAPNLDCDLSDNWLHALPGNLHALHGGGRLCLQGNALGVQAIAQLLQIGSSSSYRGPLVHIAAATYRPLSAAAAAWYANDHAAAAQRWDTFVNEPGAAEFATYLVRLAGSLQATDPTLAAPFRAHVHDWLVHLAAEPALRADTFAIVAPGNETCEDRAALVLLHMTRLRVNHDVAAGYYDAQPAALLAAVQGNRRLEALEAIAQAQMRTRTDIDEVETILAYPVGLRERLGLPIAVGAMRYPHLAHVHADDLDRAKAQVRALDASFPAYLAGHEPFQAVLERWDPGAFAQAHAQRQAAFEDGTFEARVQARLAATGAALANDPAAHGQAGQAVWAEMQAALFGPLVSAYLRATDASFGGSD